MELIPVPASPILTPRPPRPLLPGFIISSGLVCSAPSGHLGCASQPPALERDCSFPGTLPVPCEVSRESRLCSAPAFLPSASRGIPGTSSSIPRWLCRAFPRWIHPGFIPVFLPGTPPGCSAPCRPRGSPPFHDSLSPVSLPAAAGGQPQLLRVADLRPGGRAAPGALGGHGRGQQEPREDPRDPLQHAPAGLGEPAVSPGPAESPWEPWEVPGLGECLCPPAPLRG